jgi:hypothetical protein
VKFIASPFKTKITSTVKHNGLLKGTNERLENFFGPSTGTGKAVSEIDALGM